MDNLVEFAVLVGELIDPAFKRHGSLLLAVKLLCLNGNSKSQEVGGVTGGGPRNRAQTRELLFTCLLAGFPARFLGEHRLVGQCQQAFSVLAHLPFDHTTGRADPDSRMGIIAITPHHQLVDFMCELLCFQPAVVHIGLRQNDSEFIPAKPTHDIGLARMAI